MQAGGQRFESVILHSKKEIIDILEAEADLPPRNKRANQRIKTDEPAGGATAAGEVRPIYPSPAPRGRVREKAVDFPPVGRHTERRKGRMKDALALGGEEGRDKLR